jgi:hypothetical protein
MDQERSPSLFEMEMDGTAQSNLLSISKWAKFISVTGFVIGALATLGLLIGGSALLRQMAALTSFGQTDIAGAFIVGALIVMVFLGAWIYFLFRSSTMIRRGLQSRSSSDLAEGFKAMRIYFVFSVVVSLLSILGTLFAMLNT